MKQLDYRQPKLNTTECTKPVTHSSWSTFAGIQAGNMTE
jgi:hypothetical protein